MRPLEEKFVLTLLTTIAAFGIISAVTLGIHAQNQKSLSRPQIDVRIVHIQEYQGVYKDWQVDINEFNTFDDRSLDITLKRLKGSGESGIREQQIQLNPEPEFTLQILDAKDNILCIRGHRPRPSSADDMPLPPECNINRSLHATTELNAAYDAIHDPKFLVHSD